MSGNGTVGSHDLPTLKPGDINNINRPITRNWIKTVIESLSTKFRIEWINFQSLSKFKKDLIVILNFSHNVKGKETLPNSSRSHYNPGIKIQ